MQLQRAILFLLGFVTFANAIALPTTFESWTESTRDLFKRKGGGGGGGRGGGGGSRGGSGGSTGGSTGGTSGGGSRGGSTGSTSGRTSSSSNTGGSTTTGSGTTRGYGGGAYYGGGASTPYTAGAVSSRGVNPYLLRGAALGFFPGLWLYGAYAYSWPGHYTWHNDTTNQNDTGPVQCWCGEYAECGCDANNNSQYLDTVANNKSIAYRAANGTLLINGTLANGTTAPGGDSAASSLRQGLLEHSGYWIVIAGVTYAVSFL